ncbi:MAG: HlyD family efflux transporter periplasmic adaptor subunit [Clostridiaceae bacterium]|nr:HlyD family efflux transporter periplasmic adaptor subunit [Clostridiaceae bacterium]
MSRTKRLSKAERRNRSIRIGISIVAVVILLLIVAVMFFQKQVRENFASAEQEILSAEVTTGSIRTTVSGSGALVSDGITDVMIPAGVEIKKIYPEAGDSVKEGDILASVEASSVLSALSDTQKELDELGEQLADVSDNKVNSKIKTPLKGRVKAVFAEEGDDVSSVMYENGALILLSLDGYMAVNLDSTAYSIGDSVSVTDSSGNTYTGTVDKVTAEKTTVLIGDDGPVYGDTVTVGDSDSGTLYIHEELKITGYAGTVDSVKVSENSSVRASSTLIKLTDTSYSANYDSLLKQRADLEERLQTLVKLYRSGAITAPLSGIIDTVSYDENSSEAEVLNSSGSEAAFSGETETGSAQEESALLSIDPGKSMTVSISVDETDVLSLEIGQEVSVSVESIGDDTYTGKVTEIDTSSASGSGGVTTYTATVTLDRAEKMLAGMTASVSVVIKGVDNALLLPDDAVRKTSASAYVYTSRDESTGELGGMTEVTIGLSNGSYVEILEGLSEGDTVYYTESRNNNFGNFNFGMPGGGMPGGGMPVDNMPGNMPGDRNMPGSSGWTNLPGN